MKETDKRFEDPRIKGDIAQKLFELECIKRGIELYTPCSSNGRIDYIIYINNQFQRVQIKFISAHQDNISVSFTKMQNGRKTETGSPVYKKYTSEEIDLFYVYCPETDSWYDIPISIANKQRGISLRISNNPPKNNNLSKTNFAKDYIW